MTNLNELKKQADKLDITYHPRIGIDKLQAKINNVIANQSSGASSPIDKEPTKDSRAAIFTKRKEKASRLVRINVTCMNPDKKAWPGEIFSVGSRKLGTFKKYVPFNNSNGWHVPNIILDIIKNRKYGQRMKKKGPRGIDITETKLVPEFSITIMEPLTPNEMKDLANQQAMSGSIE